MQGVRYGLSPVVFGVTFALGAAGYMTGTFIGSRIVMRLGIDRLMGIGAFTMAAGGLIMAAVVALDLDNVIWFVGAMTVYLAGLGLALPSSMAGALTPFPDRAGTASSLMGFVQQTGAAIAVGAEVLSAARVSPIQWPRAGSQGLQRAKSAAKGRRRRNHHG
jgi:DHA1 family bicyclomycin/chloramphenicol resistance-like MFS transporter